MLVKVSEHGYRALNSLSNGLTGIVRRVDSLFACQPCSTINLFTKVLDPLRKTIGEWMEAKTRQHAAAGRQAYWRVDLWHFTIEHMQNVVPGFTHTHSLAFPTSTYGQRLCPNRQVTNSTFLYTLFAESVQWKST